METFSCFQPVFIESGQFACPDFITPMLSVLVKLIQYAVSSDIFACVCVRESPAKSVLLLTFCEQEWHAWEVAVVDTALCLAKHSETQGDESKYKNVK